MVNAQFEAGTSEHALATAQNAVHANPENSQLAVELASACLDHREMQAAHNLLEDALESMPEDTSVRMLLAKVSLLAQEPAEAAFKNRGQRQVTARRQLATEIRL